MAINAVLFVAITCRMISASALISAVPDLADRGAFMSVNASLQQFSGGLASSLAGPDRRAGAGRSSRCTTTCSATWWWAR